MNSPGAPVSPSFERLPGALAAPAFRLVLPRAKRERLAQRVGALGPQRSCPVSGCGHTGLAVVLVESEAEAVLCPCHALVDLAGAPVAGQPTLVTAAW
jgi:hypothetical protein